MSEAIDRFNVGAEIVYHGKRVVVTRKKWADGDETLGGYVLAKDPAGNEFFAYEASVKIAGDSQRGEGAVWCALIQDLKERG